MDGGSNGYCAIAPGRCSPANACRGRAKASSSAINLSIVNIYARGSVSEKSQPRT